jgi:hypothetical protein
MPACSAGHAPWAYGLACCCSPLHRLETLPLREPSLLPPCMRPRPQHSTEDPPPSSSLAAIHPITCSLRNTTTRCVQPKKTSWPPVHPPSLSPPQRPPPPRPPPPLTRSYSSVLKLANMLSPGSCSAYWKARLACIFSFTLRSLYVTAGGARVRTCTTTQHTRGVSSNNSHCCQSFCCAQRVCAHWRSSVLPAATDGWRVSHQVWAVMVPGAVLATCPALTPPPLWPEAASTKCQVP